MSLRSLAIELSPLRHDTEYGSGINSLVGSKFRIERRLAYKHRLICRLAVQLNDSSATGKQHTVRNNLRCSESNTARIFDGLVCCTDGVSNIVLWRDTCLIWRRIARILQTLTCSFLTRL